ncbi:MAG: hypothetical protein EPN92_14320 [Chitinophagaceae bacterium]|nr:MAG: hypothetical protein EPN92_14320 [Chitinophagaceae bacterium]
MKKSLNITATIDQPDLLGNMVEKLACRHNDIGYGSARMPDGRQALETSSTETYVSGTVALDTGKDHINMPFITCFLFTCIKGKDDHYKLTWSTSMS